MKQRTLFSFILFLFALPVLRAQTDMTGRVYYNPNIMYDNMDKTLGEMMPEAKAEAIAKKEKEKGRKLTEAEEAEIDKKVQESLKMAQTVMKGIKNETTIEFKSDKEAVMKFNMKVNEEALKTAGVSWAKRKALKAAIALAPSSEKAKYIVKGNLIIMDPNDDPDTLRLSDDGKYLYGKFDKNTNFKLTRTK